MATDPPAETPSQKVFRKAFGYFAVHNKPVLGYSGGAESNLLLELLRPFQNVLTVLWVTPRRCRTCRATCGVARKAGGSSS